MKKFQLRVSRTVTHTTLIELEATDHDAACEMVEDLKEDGTPSDEAQAELDKAEWDLKNEEYDVEECSSL